MNKLKIDEKHLEDIGIDAGGGPIVYFKNQPFTGIEVSYHNNGQLAVEIEFQDGYEEGMFRSYYENGQLEKEYFQTKNELVPGTYKEYDSEGNLVED